MRVKRKSICRIKTKVVTPFLLVLFSACGESPPQIGPEEEKLVVDLAEPIVAELQRSLVTHLTAAMQEGGPVNAIGFCSTEALPLTQQVQAGFEQGLELKRTSFRYRNVDNAPDEAEELALLYFEEAAGGGRTVPSRYVQKVSAEEFRYYKPLFIGEVCVQCHGQKEALSPEVRSLLEDRYPGDLAVGYEPGAFRGLVRVSVPASALQTVPEG